MAQLLPRQQVQLTGFGGPVGAGQAFGTAATLTGAAAQAQQTPPAGPGSPWPSLSSTPSRGTRASIDQANGGSANWNVDNITPDPAAVSSLEQTSVPTGHLSVPELDLHTIGDNLVPVTMENLYAKQVTEAGDRSLLRQAYTSTFGHRNFSPAELVAGVLALSHRVTTGSWDAVADPASLNRVAAGLNLGAARFAEDYSPGSLTGAIGANNAPPSQG